MWKLNCTRGTRVMLPPPTDTRNKNLSRAYGAPFARPAVLLLVAVAAVYLTHVPFLHLPYYWDEAGQFVPAARDILILGKWIPVSTLPNVHPPGLMAYLAFAWRLAGYAPATTRIAMLALAAVGLFSALLLSRELLPHRRRTAYFAVLLLFASPLFFAQSMLAQLDLPAMVFTVLALWLFLRGRPRLSAGVCVALVLVKETGLVVALVFAIWLIRERRWREACWFALPCAALAGWIAILTIRTGHWAGNEGFVSYNVFYPLSPARLAVSLLRRLYFLFLADGCWIGAAAILSGWRRSTLFRSRAWRIAFTIVAAHLSLMVLLGGAGLDRYLLPILPIVYSAMAAGIFMLPRMARTVAATLLVAALAAGNWLNPPHPFPYEDNLAFVDFLTLQRQAADYLAAHYPDEPIKTAWPLTLELSRPQLGFVSRALPVSILGDFAPDSLRQIQWNRVQVLVTFSRSWNPPLNLMHVSALRSFWIRHYGELPASRGQAASLIPLRPVARFERRGQWVDIFFNPASGE